MQDIKTVKIRLKNFRLVLGCEGLNIFKVIQPNQKELKNLIDSASLILEIVDIMLSTSLQLAHDNGSLFECTNNPIIDYHNLTNNLNVASLLKKVSYFLISLRRNK